MRQTGVGSGEFDLIHLVRHRPGISQKEICLTLNMDKAAVARRVSSLEQKGYLYRKPNPDDKRSSLLYATPEADALKNSKAHVEAGFYSWLVSELPGEDLDSFVRILGTLYQRSKQESRAGFPHTSVIAAETSQVSADDSYIPPEEREND